MTETIGDRIRRFRKRAGLTGIELGRRIGVTKGTISQWENDINKPGGENLYALCDELGVDALELLEGSKGAGEPQKAGVSNAVKVRIPKKIPLISWVSAGAWCDSPDSFAPGDAEDWLPLPNKAGPRSYALRVEGDSMTSPYPGTRSYPHGTIIYVDPDRSVTNGCRVVARTPDGNYTFKTYTEDAGHSYLKPINPQYPIVDITEHMHICGVVIGSYMPE